MMKSIISGLILALVLLGNPGQISANGFVTEMSTKADFDKFARAPLSGKYGNVSGVKVIYDLRTRKLHYVDGMYYKYHYDYCLDRLAYFENNYTFNKDNYSDSPKRRFLLGNVNYFEGGDIFLLEINPADVMRNDHILLLYNAVAASFFAGSELKFFINTPKLVLRKSELSTLPLITPAQVFNDLTYQAVGMHKGQGRLKFVEDLKSEFDHIDPTDIIVIKHTPLYLPEVAGVIVTTFQTPLSHLTILAQNRKIPICASKRAFTDSTLQSLNGKLIELDVQRHGYKIARIDQLKPGKNRVKTKKLTYNLEEKRLLATSELTSKSSAYCGNKAANFGTLHKLSQKHNFSVPEAAFVIPFYHYWQHVQNSGAAVFIDTLTLTAISSNNTKRDSLLQVIKSCIMEHPVDSELMSAIDSMITAQGPWRRMRFRSSTNAEDAEGFSGAGLYTSKTGILGDTIKSPELAIKKVWASMWSEKAYNERSYFSINHRDAYMGVLVHRSFPNEHVNGVAITKNLYRKTYPGFVVNAQVGNFAVVDPEPGVICDQFICYPKMEKYILGQEGIVDMITSSNKYEDELIMSLDEIQNLANSLKAVKDHFYDGNETTPAYSIYGLDIEFKLDGPERTLYLKQVRPYND